MVKEEQPPPARYGLTLRYMIEKLSEYHSSGAASANVVQIHTFQQVSIRWSPSIQS
jgi:hypothetical protein